jgi:hypothetical protein
VADAQLRWRWDLLYDALTALAGDPEVQVEQLGRAHPDELALDFDNARGLVELLKAEGVNFSVEAIDVLETLDAELWLMSGNENAELWTRDALRTSDHWGLVRQLARRAVELLPPPP